MMLWRLSSRAQRMLHVALDAVGGSKYQYTMMVAIEGSQPVSQAELARITGIDRSDVVAILNDLSAKHAIERSVNPEDRRQNVVTLTPEGKALLDRLQVTVDEVQEAFLAPLSDEQRQRFVDLCEILLLNDASA